MNVVDTHNSPIAVLSFFLSRIERISPTLPTTTCALLRFSSSLISPSCAAYNLFPIAPLRTCVYINRNVTYILLLLFPIRLLTSFPKNPFNSRQETRKNFVTNLSLFLSLAIDCAAFASSFRHFLLASSSSHRRLRDNATLFR